MKTSYDVLIGPLLTEKGAMLKDKQNKALFRVAKGANKIEIKKAVEVIFKVKVDHVATVNCKGKMKRMGKYEGKRSDWKKAVVSLKKRRKAGFY